MRTDPPDNRPHVLRDVSELKAGDVVLAWTPGDPCGNWTVSDVDLAPYIGYRAEIAKYRVNVTFAHGYVAYNATGARKVAPRMTNLEIYCRPDLAFYEHAATAAWDAMTSTDLCWSLVADDSRKPG